MPVEKVDAKVLTQFGATVLSLMAEKGITTHAELLRLLDREGLRISQPGFSAWLYGKNPAAKDFPVKFTRALHLDEPQKMRLAMAFTYGQSKPVSLGSENRV